MTKKCNTCIYGNASEYEKPCIVYKQDCEHYKRSEEMVNEHEMQIINDAFDMSRADAIDELCRLASDIPQMMLDTVPQTQKDRFIRAIKVGVNSLKIDEIYDLEMENASDFIIKADLFKMLDDFCGHDRSATITLDTLADLVAEM